MKKRLQITLLLLMGIVSVSSAQIRLPEKPKRAGHIDYSIKESGYWIAAQANADFATNGKNHSAAFQFDLIQGYRFSEFLKVGIGVSPRFYTNAVSDFCGKNGRPFSVPIYADVRGNITPQADAMFAFCWSADLGYAINEGIYVSPGIGMRFGDIRHNFLAGISYAFQQHNVASKNSFIHIIGLRLGYEF